MRRQFLKSLSSLLTIINSNLEAYSYDGKNLDKNLTRGVFHETCHH